MSRYRDASLLRFLTCGGIDHGKSTLIGRLLHDSGNLFDDQIAAVRQLSSRRGDEADLDFSLFVDGLEAEQEQGITIDVAYRYFLTSRRKFILADSPGHEQYTRNMATAASNCEVALVLVDATQGVVNQTRRHAFIASLFGIRHLALCINKMDLVDWSEERFEEIRQSFVEIAARLDVTDVEFIPVAAKGGDNIVHPSANTPWYNGRPVLDYLENVYVESDRNLIDLRLPVQTVLRPGDGRRLFAGTLASGVLRTGDEVVLMPSGARTHVLSIESSAAEVAEAVAPMAVAITLADEVDAARGELIVHPHNVPTIANQLEAMLVWMDAEPLTFEREYLLKQLSSETPAAISTLRYRIDVETLRRATGDTLSINDVGRVHIRLTRELLFDAYSKNQSSGAFILIDRTTNATVAAGVILDRESSESDLTTPERKSRSVGQPILWFAGRQLAELAEAIERELSRRGVLAALLQSSGRSPEIERLASLLSRDGAIVIVVSTEQESASGLVPASIEVRQLDDAQVQTTQTWPVDLSHGFVREAESIVTRLLDETPPRIIPDPHS